MQIVEYVAAWIDLQLIANLLDAQWGFSPPVAGRNTIYRIGDIAGDQHIALGIRCVVQQIQHVNRFTFNVFAGNCGGNRRRYVSPGDRDSRCLRDGCSIGIVYGVADDHRSRITSCQPQVKAWVYG